MQSAREVSGSTLPDEMRVGSFVPVTLPAAHGAAWIELTLVDGTLIRVPRDQLAALELILQTLQGRTAATLLREPQHA